MQMIYNSPNYCVLEFPPQVDHHILSMGGYEIVDKKLQREFFMDGALAAQFRKEVQKLMDNDRSVDEVDAFLERYDQLMNHPVILH